MTGLRRSYTLQWGEERESSTHLEMAFEQLLRGSLQISSARLGSPAKTSEEAWFSK
jgi:hypothetical protein